MRLFTALLLTPEMKNALSSAMTGLRKNGVAGNYTPAANLHMTLAFIGEYGDPRRVLEALSGLKAGPVTFALSGFGTFGDLLWAGLEPQAGLSALAGRVRACLSSGAVPFDGKAFRPHITLVRGASRAPAPDIPRVSMTADRVSLMLSRRASGRMEYSELGSVPLLG